MPSARLPGFVIYGSIRSGTTSLARYLGEHPSVFMATQKELHFFDQHFDLGLDWYMSHFTDANARQVSAEATPAYIAEPKAIERMAATIPGAKLIASFRDPTKRAWSDYWMRYERRSERRPFFRALKDELEAYQRQGPGAEGLRYLKHGLYAHHIRKTLEHFPREQLHVTIFERLVTNPAEEYERICRFLSIDDSHIPELLGTPVNPYVSFRSPALRNRLNRLGSHSLARIVAVLNTRRGDRYPELDQNTRAHLDDFFQAHNAELEAILGERIIEWS